MAIRSPHPLPYSLPLASAVLTIHLTLSSQPLIADPIVTIEEKGQSASPAEPSYLQARRSAWIAELDSIRTRIKRRVGVNLDVELAKSLCRSGSIERCEEAVVELQSQVTSLLMTSTSPRTPPAPSEPPRSTTSVVILTEPRHHYYRDRTKAPSSLATPRPPEPPSKYPSHQSESTPINHRSLAW